MYPGSSNPKQSQVPIFPPAELRPFYVLESYVFEISKHAAGSAGV